MGRIGVLSEIVRRTDEGENVSEVTIDVGGGEVIRPPHFTTPGVDSMPLPGDYVATTSAPGAAGQAAVGYADPVNEQRAESGEVRLIGRDSNGAQICEMWLKNDGTVTIVNEKSTITISADGGISAVNGAGSFELKANGQFDVNGGNFTVDP